MRRLQRCLNHATVALLAVADAGATRQRGLAGVAPAARRLRHRNPRLHALLGVGGSRLPAALTDALLQSPEKRARLAASVGNALRHADLQGLELQLAWGPAPRPARDAKASLVGLLKALRYEIDQESDLLLERGKRAYDVSESILEDYTTSEWTPTRPDGSSLRIQRRRSTTTTSTSTSTEDSALGGDALNYLALERAGQGRRLLLLRLPQEPEVLVKRFDFKNISKYVDYMTVPTDNITDSTERGVTYHPSRLMGISDLLNTDSMLDLLTGLGAPHSLLIITVPGAAASFTLQDAARNTPRSAAVAGPESIPQTQSKYVLVRGLAGAALRAVDDEDWTGACGRLHEGLRAAASLLRIMHRHFTQLARKPRAALLAALEEEVHEAAAVSYSGERPPLARAHARAD
ncbi:Chitinase-3-like protein 3 [Gryllus bimaculatus]|nr:Chitinase-3-like protein 3 [Gryllus bimaculatus]